MANAQVRVDPARPIEVEMRVHTPLFAEVSMYLRRAGDAKWTEFAYFDLSELDDGVVAATAPALGAGGQLLLRTILWGGKTDFVIRPFLRQAGLDCQGSPPPETVGDTRADGSKMVDLIVELA